MEKFSSNTSGYILSYIEVCEALAAYLCKAGNPLNPETMAWSCEGATIKASVTCSSQQMPQELASAEAGG